MQMKNKMKDMLRIDRRLLANFDFVLLILLLVVCAAALSNLYSASYPPKSLATTPYIKQGVFLLISSAIFLVIICIDYQELLFWNYPMYVLVLLLLVFAIFMGHEANGSQRWINLGFFKPVSYTHLTLPTKRIV